jgi:flavorubredoxin
MKAVAIKPDIYWVGVKDWNLREFHGYNTPNGSTYNSYLIKDEHITLVDGVKAYLSDENLARIASVTDFGKIDYLIVNHVEMDHSGNIPEIMKQAPQATVVTNAAGKAALEAHFDTTGWNFKIIKTGDTLNIGKRNLSFLTTPMLHWPDSMMTYVAEDKLLLPNDGFGQHLCCDALFVKDCPNDLVVAAAKSYYANILLPYGAQASKALTTACDLELDIEMIAPSHGLIWSGKQEVSQILGLYGRWARGEQQHKAVIVYDTMWGATAKLAETAMAEFEDAGIPVVKYSLAQTHISDVMTEVLDAEYVLIGTPTLNNQLFPRVAAFVTYLKGLAPKNKKGMAFASYGWKAGVSKEIKTAMDELGWQTADSFEEKYTPKSDVLERFAEHVKAFIALNK